MHWQGMHSHLNFSKQRTVIFFVVVEDITNVKVLLNQRTSNEKYRRKKGMEGGRVSGGGRARAKEREQDRLTEERHRERQRDTERKSETERERERQRDCVCFGSQKSVHFPKVSLHNKCTKQTHT